MVRRKLGSYPASVTDDNEVYFDTGTATSDTTSGAPVTVGGNIFPISKASVLTPWLALFSFLLIGICQLNRYL